MVSVVGVYFQCNWESGLGSHKLMIEPIEDTDLKKSPGRVWGMNGVSISCCCSGGGERCQLQGK